MMEHECQCNDHSIMHLDRKSLSYLISIAALCLFISFVAGYFVGKRQAISDVISTIEKDSFSNRIQYSVNSLYDKGNLSHNKTVQELTPLASNEKKIPDTNKSLHNDVEGYYAELVGYGYAKTAQKFAQRLKKRGIDVEIKERVSKTPKGVMRTWYQVVTKQFNSLDNLQSLIYMLEQDEKLHDVQIKTITA